MEDTIYEGKSSLVSVKINGKYIVQEVKIESDEEALDDVSMLEDMFMLAMNDAVKKIEEDKEKKMGKYGQGLAGLM